MLPHSVSHYEKTGVSVDEDLFQTLQTCDSLLLGAVGDDRYPGILEQIILRTSQRFALSIGIRPSYLHDPSFCPLVGKKRGDIDVVVIRDSTEGEMAIRGGSIQFGTPAEASASLIVHTRYGVEKTLRYSFELARQRRGRLSVVSQANSVTAHEIWPRTLREIQGDYPDVEAFAQYPDNAAADMVSHPEKFDVMVSTIMIGGILSDIAATLVGGVGLIGSSRLNPDTGFGLFEPLHGTAPRYVGKDRVSPLAMFNALAMLLENLGEDRSASRLRGAIDAAITEGAIQSIATSTNIGTKAMSEAVRSRLVDHG